MKKALLVLLSVFLITTKVYAVTAEDTKVDLKDYETLNFKDILKEEGIKESFKDYGEKDDQITIYLFRGHGCGYCKSFLNFLNSITDEYGKYFKVVGFEVWSNKENSELLKKTSTFLGSEAGGVPYIIIGDTVFPGYADTYNDGIKQAIKEEYDSEERFDVFKEYNKAIDRAKKAAKGNTGVVLFFTFVFVAAGTIIVLVDNKKKFNKIMERLENTKKVEIKNNNVKEEKKEVKKGNANKRKK